MDTPDSTPITASELGLKGCLSCGRLQKLSDNRACADCAAPVHSRRTNSLQRTWAFLLVGMIAFVPANIMPFLITESFSGNVQDTIMSGVFSLISTGNHVIAAIIFVASICIPVPVSYTHLTLPTKRIV